MLLIRNKDSAGVLVVDTKLVIEIGFISLVVDRLEEAILKNH